MFDILIYLFETYIHNELNVSIDYEILKNDLSDIGFQHKDIFNALVWLKKLSSYKENMVFPEKSFSNQISTRIYTKEESLRLNIDCRGFMFFLEQLEIITIDTREIIIESIMALDNIELNLEDFKWIVLIVLFNIPGCEIVYHKLENLLFNVPKAIIH